MADYYHFKNIRTLLTEGFTAEELLTLCFDEPALRPVYENWSQAAGKGQLVRLIIDHAHRRVATDSVLNWAKGLNPVRYEKHQPYYQFAGQETRGAFQAVASMLPDSELGRGIALGGLYQNQPLRIVATEWTAYGLSQVRSGWLFISQWTENHAIAFFKIHVSDDGQGYIHIVDTSEPHHLIWLTTKAGFRQEQEFHYIAHPADLWTFTWR